ncbi:MAG TPA: isoprenylcysteine carboxylmethyltransferase family protein [Thermoanaerobaculia bacterium]|nr:isoprenylcysteine carboxylmethyltransferase family protein [Thermoanaerobaculia bacterium]
MTSLLFAASLFVPAGTLRWPAAWTYLVLMFGFSIGISVWLLRHDPDLLAERMSGIGRADQESWDKILLSITAVGFFGWHAAMGFDRREHASTLPDWLRGGGGLLLLTSFYVFFLAFRENAFLSPAVRIQTDRGHRLVDTGPYGLVRHPLYAGFALYAVGVALLLGSWRGLGGAAILIALVARRAVLEERLLRGRLEGYAAYAERVRYRLVPGIW